MIHIRTSLPTAILYIFSFYKQPIIQYLDFVLILTRLFWRSCEWQVIDFEPYDTGSNRKKIYDNKKTHPSIMFMNVLLAGQQHLLPFYQRFHLGIFFQLWWKNWGLFTPSSSSSACLYPLLHSPLSLPLPSRTVHIYSYSCSCSWIYICYCEA